MVRIERATDPRYPATETTLEHFGIKGLYDIFRFAHANACPISFSPAIALSEMPAEKAATAATRYFAFTQRFGLDLTDDPDQGEFPAMGYQGPPSIWSVDDRQRKFMAVNYTHQLLMLYIRHTGKRRTPLQNFDLFLYEAVSNSFFLSTRDIAIARYVFADSEKGDESVKKICREVRKNFCKFDDRDPINLAEMDACALNASFDLLLENFANRLHLQPSLGQHDTWIVTGDRKLALFMAVCHSFDLGTGEPGIASAMTAHHTNDGYMEQSLKNMKFLLETRQRNMPSKAGVSEMNGMLRRVHQRVADGLAEHQTQNGRR